MEVIAKLKSLRIAPRKVRLVAGLIRRMPAEAAEKQLVFLNKASSLPVLKLLRSAMANAEHNFDMNVDNLIVSSACVDQGPTMKRIHPRSRGQAFKILKRSSHVTIAVAEK